MVTTSAFFKGSKHFKASEFECPTYKKSGLLMDTEFLHMLEKARIYANIPFIIISGYRTVKQNIKVGGTINSSHLKGLACDIKYENSKECFLIIKSLLVCGFNRIGINKGAIHVDFDNNKPQNVIWNYYS